MSTARDGGPPAPGAGRNDVRGMARSVTFLLALGTVALVMGVAVLRHWLPVVLGAVLVASAVSMRGVLARSSDRAVATSVTVAGITTRGWADVTELLRDRAGDDIPAVAATHLGIDARTLRGAWIAAGADRLTGVHPSWIQAAGRREDLVPAPVTAVETWTATSAGRRRGRVTGVTLEPRVAAWTTLPRPVGPGVLAPDDPRVGRPELAGWWTVHLHGRTLLVVPGRRWSSPEGKPPTLLDVVDELAHAVVTVHAGLARAAGPAGDA